MSSPPPEPNVARSERIRVAAWFDETYARLGRRYLRPPDAYPIFVQLLGAKPGQRLLDVACGPGMLLQAAHARGVRPHGVDISHTALRQLREGLPEAGAARADAERLPFASGSFDHVTCVGALERMFDRPAALREMARVGAPGARYCFMVRNARTLVWRLYREALGKRNVDGHQDALDLDAWRELFHATGFELLEVHADQWPQQRLAKAARLWRERDPRADERVRKPLLPMRFVNEFVVVLEKRPEAESGP